MPNVNVLSENNRSENVTFVPIDKLFESAQLWDKWMSYEIVPIEKTSGTLPI